MDTSTPQGRMLFQMSGVFGELGRAMIVERVKAGLRLAKAERTKLGRPRVSVEIEGQTRELAFRAGDSPGGQLLLEASLAV